MNVVRAFIAINLSLEIQHKLDQVSSELRKRLEENVVRWVPAKNIHLTLKFLGDVSIANLDLLKKILQVQTGRFPEFEISVGELGAFPSTHRPRVIWVGIQAPVELRELQHAIDFETAAIGYASEERAFSPHLTIGRVSRNVSSHNIHQISNVLENLKVGFLGATRVNAVHLYKSDLTPGGAIYTILDTAILRKPV